MSTPFSLLVSCASALLLIEVFIRPVHIHWVAVVLACLAYATGITIFTKLYLKKYALSLGLSKAEQLSGLNVALKTGVLPDDEELLNTMPAYLDRRMRFVSRQRKVLPSNIVIAGILCILGIAERSMLSAATFGLFTAIGTYSYFYGIKKYESRIAHLQTELEHRRIRATVEAVQKNEQWDRTLLRGRRIIWISSTVLILPLVVLVVWAADKQNEWSVTRQSHTFTSSTYNFTIDFPGEPSTSSHMLETTSGKELFPYTVYSSYINSGTQNYCVVVYPWPEQQNDFANMSSSDLKSSLIDFVNQDLRASNAKLVTMNQKQIFSGNTLAEEAKFLRQAQDGSTITGYDRVFTIGNNEYDILAQNSGEAAFEHFADSFHYTESSSPANEEQPDNGIIFVSPN